MILRPYQFCAGSYPPSQNSNDNAYIWHTTGSGKTCISGKPNCDGIARRTKSFLSIEEDLDYQTMTEFNAFKRDVDVTNNTIQCKLTN
jgi:type I restriction enzyme R subunit